MTPGDTRRITRFCLGTLVGGLVGVLIHVIDQLL